MDLKGSIYAIGDTEQISDTFQKRQLVLIVAENPDYPEYIPVEAVQDKTTLLDGLNVGDEVTASVNLGGRKYDKKTGGEGFFLSLKLWRINLDATGSGDTAQEASGNTAQEDDLPF